MIGLLVVALVVGGAVLWLIDRVIEDQRIGLYLIVIVAVAQLVIDLPRPAVMGLSVTVNDFVFAIVMAALLARFLRGWSPTTLQLGVILLLVVVGYSIARGADTIGVAAAVNEARETLYLLAVILYAGFLASDRMTREDVAKLWITYALGLVGVAVLRWAMVFGGLPGRGDWFDPAFGGLRVIFSNETLAIGVAFLILLPRVLLGVATRREWQLASVFGMAVLLMQHRSVIAVVLVCTAVMLWRLRDRLSRRLVYGGGVASLLIGILMVTALDGGQLASQATSADAANTVTFQWRVQGWQVLLRDSTTTGPQDALLGKPYGSGFERLLPTGRRVNVAPHNMYLELLLRVGIVGLLLFLSIGITAWTRLRRSAPSLRGAYLDDFTLSVILIALALYMVPYNLFTQTGILVGLALSAAANPGADADPPSEEAPAQQTLFSEEWSQVPGEDPG